jgi:hypothetical protein
MVIKYNSLNSLNKVYGFIMFSCFRNTLTTLTADQALYECNKSVVVVRKQTIPTERPPLVGEVSANFYGYRVWRGQRNGSPRPLISVFYTRSRYIYIKLAPQLHTRGWVDLVPNPLLLRKSDSAGNLTADLWICSQELWPLDHRGGLSGSTTQKYMNSE